MTDLTTALEEYQERFNKTINVMNLRFLRDDKESEYADFIMEHVRSGILMTDEDMADPRFFNMPPEGCLW